MIRFKFSRWPLIALTVMLLSACGVEPEKAPVTDEPEVDALDAASKAYVHLDKSDRRGHSINLVFAEVDEGVLVSGQLSGFTYGQSYALHVHNASSCKSFRDVVRSAHFDPQKRRHGDPDLQEHHVGDLPNTTADTDGNLHLDRLLMGARLGSGDNYDLLGRVFVVHEGVDDYQSEPEGNAGWVLACFSIRR